MSTGIEIPHIVTKKIEADLNSINSSSIQETSARQFVSESQKQKIDNTYTKTEVDDLVSGTVPTSKEDTLEDTVAWHNLEGELRRDYVPFVDIEIEKYFADYQKIEINGNHYMHSLSGRARFDFRDDNFILVPATYNYAGQYQSNELATFGPDVGTTTSGGFLSDNGYIIFPNIAATFKMEITKAVENSTLSYNIISRIDYFSNSTARHTVFTNSTKAVINSTTLAVKYIRIYPSAGNIKGQFELYGKTKGFKKQERYSVAQSIAPAVAVSSATVELVAKPYEYSLKTK